MWQHQGVVINADKVNQRAYAIVFVVTEHINPNLYGPSGNLEATQCRVYPTACASGD